MNVHAEKIAASISQAIHEHEKFDYTILQEGIAMALSDAFEESDARIADLEGEVQQLRAKVEELEIRP